MRFRLGLLFLLLVSTAIAGVSAAKPAPKAAQKSSTKALSADLNFDCGPQPRHLQLTRARVMGSLDGPAPRREPLDPR